MNDKKYCKFCGEQIDIDCVVCPKCGKQVEMLKQTPPAYQRQPNVVINNTNKTINTYGKHEKNKWVALLLCIFLGVFGAHKFYEGKFLMGILYIFTLGLFLIGWVVDIILILMKPNPYLV